MIQDLLVGWHGGDVVHISRDGDQARHLADYFGHDYDNATDDVTAVGAAVGFALQCLRGLTTSGSTSRGEQARSSPRSRSSIRTIAEAPTATPAAARAAL